MNRDGSKAVMLPGEQEAQGTEAPRRPYDAPRLERLGAWSALTLQQSIPIGPGGFLFDLAGSERLG